jgi:excisionase family DNA binding protein
MTLLYSRWKAKENTMNESFLNLEQVAKVLGVSERTVLRLLDKKEIKGFKVGRAWRFAQSDIDEYVEQQRKRAGEPSAA